MIDPADVRPAERDCVCHHQPAFTKFEEMASAGKRQEYDMV